MKEVNTFTNEELQLLGVAIAKISARVSQFMTRYPPENAAKLTLNASKSRRAHTTIKLLFNYLNEPQFRYNNSNNKNMKQFVREFYNSDIPDNTDILTSWEVKGCHSMSTKEETVIMQSLKQRGIIENIVGTKNLKKENAFQYTERGGYPSIYRLSAESKKMILLLSRKEAVDFIMTVLWESKLLFIMYWYYFNYLPLLIKNYDISVISKILKFFDYCISKNQEDGLTSFLKVIPEMKSTLPQLNNSQITHIAKEITSELITKNNLTNIITNISPLFMILSLCKLNKALD